MRTYPIKLQHENLVPNSEVITIPGGQYNALVRDEDYTMDYINGIVNIILTGRIAHLPGIGTRDFDLDITYNRQVDFAEEFILDSHIEVFNEVAEISNVYELQVAHGPIGDVFRVFNKTTGEEYQIDSFLGQTILIAGTQAPRTVDLTNQEVVLLNRNVSDGLFANTAMLILPDYLTPAKEHALNVYNNIISRTGYKTLIRGGIDIIQNTYELNTTAETVTVELCTGSTILRRANRTLIEGVDYYATMDSAGTKLTITLTDAGKIAIGRNSVFYLFTKTHRIQEHVLYDGVDILDTQHRFTFTQSYVSEVCIFDAEDHAQLLKFEPYIEKQQEVDILVYPTLIVTNQTGTITYTENTDYTIDTVFKRLVRVPTSSKLSQHSVVKVIYIENESFIVDSVTIAQDVVVVDYDYGTNSLDWSPSYIDEDVQEVRTFSKDLRFFTLSQFPANTDVRVYRAPNGQGVESINVVNVDLAKRHVEVVPLPQTTTYIVQYVARKQVFNPNTTYYVSYRYGARKRALMDNFATLLGITTGTIARTETFDMINGQSSVKLSFAPTDPSRVIIYAVGDPDKTNVTTIRAWDASTYTLEFVPIVSAGTYTVEYPVVGFETEELRKAIIALSQAFNLGPTKAAVELVGKALTNITPDVQESLTNGFTLANDSTGDYLVPIEPVISPVLSDGTSSITFVPSRFNNGVELRASNNAWIGYSALNDVRIEEGTFSFLLGTLWDGNDEQSHQLFDLTGTNEFTNRITLYKSKRSMLAFEVFDTDSKLYRVTTDVSRIPRNVILHLIEGQSNVQLPYAPAYTIMDFNSNEQSDIFEANETEFVITPVFGGATGLGLGITTLVQIPNDITYQTEGPQRYVANKLRTLAGVYENHGAKLTIQTEMSFIVGCQLFDNVLKELYLRGHDVHLYLDIPPDVISDEERELYILERRNALATLDIGGADLDGVAGGYIIEDFATRYPVLGFDYASAYIDPITHKALEDRTDVFRASTGPDFSIPDPSGQLIYMPGDIIIDFQKNPMIVQSFIPITDSLITAMNIAKPDVVNTWYFTLNINDFTPAEVVLFDQWLESTVDPLVRAGKVAWRTLLQSLCAFREYEQFLEINRNRVRFVTDAYGAYGYGGSQEIKALQWDQVTKTLTFTPVDKTGYYLFSYISGFSKFEEAEHLITCVWKLHTDDGQPAMVRMYLDGELMNHKVFGDL